MKISTKTAYNAGKLNGRNALKEEILLGILEVKNCMSNCPGSLKSCYNEFCPLSNGFLGGWDYLLLKKYQKKLGLKVVDGEVKK